ncbi:MAG: hypothetical protein KAT05_06180 [Spirochaetes bacterium]|nr:hypothetical protein [Spirochaetota bacterium]
MHINGESQFLCKECGWQFPKELIDNLIKEEEESIYCEQCGTVNNKKDFGERQISQKIHQEKSKNLYTLFSAAKKKSKEYREKIKSHLKKK